MGGHFIEFDYRCTGWAICRDDRQAQPGDTYYGYSCAISFRARDWFSDPLQLVEAARKRGLKGKAIATLIEKLQDRLLGGVSFWITAEWGGGVSETLEGKRPHAPCSGGD
ncbi:MAG: hypothetical protein ACIAS6_03465 [Phycisphaerales bacterium JB060]